MKKLLISILFVGIYIFSANAQVTVSGSVGKDGSYATLSAAIAAITSASQTSADIVITISSTTSEPTTGVAISAFKNWNSVTIYPTASGVTITGNASATTALINFSGVSKVTFDGRVNQSGNADMTIANNNTGQNTLNFTSAAQNNTVKYCIIKGGTTSNTKGIVQFGSSGNGNSYNTLDHNIITNNGTRSVYPIYSNGGTTGYPTQNTITNNVFYDCISLTASAKLIYLGTSLAGNTGWTIKGNSFYDTGTSTTNGTTHIISINSGTGYDISDNVIGGSASGNTGTWTKSNTNSGTFTAIYFSSTSTGSNSIKNNTIKNFSWANAAGGVFWYGIDLTGAIDATIDENNIGDNTTTGSIDVTFGAANGIVGGIYVESTSTGTVSCINNKIGSIKGNSSGTGYAVTVFGINKGTGSTGISISNNTIGSTTIDNSINSTTNISGQNVSGIICTSTGTNVISNNQIAGLTNGTPDNNMYGIKLGGGTYTVNANSIFNFQSPNSATCTVYGIYMDTPGNNTVYNNIISLGNNIAQNINGMFVANTPAATYPSNSIYYNTVVINGAPTSGSNNNYAFYDNSTGNNRDIRNNIFSVNRLNNGATGKNYAIRLTSTTGTQICDYNDLYIASDATYNFIGNYNGADKADLAAWQASLAGLATNSVSVNPSFVNAGSYITTDYKGLASLSGNAIGGITTDYAGRTRVATPKVGAWEEDYSIWDGSAWDVSPTLTTNATINGNYTGAGFTCLDLNVNAGKQLSVTSGTLAVNRNMTLKSDASNGTATFIDNGGTLSVGANKTFVEQYLTSGRNWYISSPVSAATSNVFATSVSNPMYYYVETTPNSWSQITNTSTTLDAKKGYIVNINSDRVVTFNGGNLNTGNQTISGLTSGGASYTGFNLVGNPYPSYLDWSTTTKTNVSTSIWYRSKSTGVYLFQTYNVAGAGIGTNGGTNLIPPMQGFWVRVTNGTGSIDLTNNDRAHLDQSVSTNRLKSPKVDERTIVRLQVSNGINTDETVVYTDAEASNNMDRFDSNKMFNNNAAVPEIYTVLGSEKLAINGYNTISPNQEIAVGFKTTSANTFTLKASELTNLNPDTKVILVDKSQGNTEFDLSAGESYSFTSDVTDNNTRFSIIYKSAAATTDLASLNSTNAKVYVNANKQVVIESDIATNYSIYNALGQKIRSGNLNNNQAIVSDLMAGQFYIVKSGNTVQRVIIN